MSVAAGALSSSAIQQNQVTITSAVATGGTGPYTYQLYRSTTTGFSPGGGTLIAGATTLTYIDTGLIPNTTYFYVMIATDTGHSNDTANSSQLTVVTAAPTQSQNQFAQSSQLGKVDLQYNINTVAVQLDSTQSGVVYAGTPVKMVSDAANLTGVPKVVAISATTDQVIGYVNYNPKNVSWVAGQALEISMAGNVISLYSAAAVTRGVQVVPVLSTNGGVAAANASGGESIVGWAFDGASAAGQLIRVVLSSPSFKFDS
jgi:hypothetical protein